MSARGPPGLMNCLSSQSSALTQGGGGSTSATGMKARSWAPRRWLGPPRVTWLALVSLLSGLLTSSQAKVFSRCELAKELNRLGLDGFRGYELADCENLPPWLGPGSSLPPLPPLPFFLVKGVWPWELSESQLLSVKP